MGHVGSVKWSPEAATPGQRPPRYATACAASGRGAVMAAEDSAGAAASAVAAVAPLLLSPSTGLPARDLASSRSLHKATAAAEQAGCGQKSLHAGTGPGQPVSQAPRGAEQLFARAHKAHSPDEHLYFVAGILQQAGVAVPQRVSLISRLQGGGRGGRGRSFTAVCRLPPLLTEGGWLHNGQACGAAVAPTLNMHAAAAHACIPPCLSACAPPEAAA